MIINDLYKSLSWTPEVALDKDSINRNDQNQVKIKATSFSTRHFKIFPPFRNSRLSFPGLN